MRTNSVPCGHVKDAPIRERTGQPGGKREGRGGEGVPLLLKVESKAFHQFLVRDESSPRVRSQTSLDGTRWGVGEKGKRGR